MPFFQDAAEVVAPRGPEGVKPEAPESGSLLAAAARQENTIVSYGPNRRICAACGKLLEVYPTRESFLAAKADHTEEELINLRQRLDKERSVSDARTLDASKIAVTDLSATGITKTKKAKE